MRGQVSNPAHAGSGLESGVRRGQVSNVARRVPGPDLPERRPDPGISAVVAAPLQLLPENVEVGALGALDDPQRTSSAADADQVAGLQREAGLAVEGDEDLVGP